MTSRWRPCWAIAVCTFWTAGFTALEDQLRHQLERFRLDGAADQRGDAGGLPAGQPLLDALPRAAQRDLIHERVGHRRRRLVLLAPQVEVLDTLRVALVAVAAHQLVVEVLAPRAHAPHVEGQARLDHRVA